MKGNFSCFGLFQLKVSPDWECTIALRLQYVTLNLKYVPQPVENNKKKITVSIRNTVNNYNNKVLT